MNRRAEYFAGPSVRLERFSGEELLLLAIFGGAVTQRRVNKELNRRAVQGRYERHEQWGHGSVGAA